MLINNVKAILNLAERLKAENIPEDTLIEFVDSDFNTYIINENYSVGYIKEDDDDFQEEYEFGEKLDPEIIGKKLIFEIE